MTEAQLKEIEAALGVTLPDYYRSVSLAFPFKPIGHDWVYWMYDEPNLIINETRYPLEDGEYDKSTWKSSYLTFGQSASGDPYFLDLSLSQSPVYYLSHEDHSIGIDWPSFEAFVEDWKAEELAGAKRRAEALQQQHEETKRWQRLLLILFLAYASLPIAVWLLRP